MPPQSARPCVAIGHYVLGFANMAKGVLLIATDDGRWFADGTRTVLTRSTRPQLQAGAPFAPAADPASPLTWRACTRIGDV